MPLRAFIGGREISAPLLNNRQWEALKREITDDELPVVLPCCDGHGYLRVSQQGLKHFVHKRGETKCDWKPETWQHLKAKSDILLACAAAGYTAQAEFASTDWRADVLATRENVRIAFEVQWSPQNLWETLDRQKRYARDGVRGCWFFRKPPRHMTRDLALEGPELDARQDLPLFPLEVDDNGKTSIHLYDHRYSLNRFVKALLSGHVRFCKEVTAKPEQKVRVVFFDMKCQGCGESSHLYFVDANLISQCGLRFRLPGDLYNDTFTFLPELITAVQAHLQTKRGQQLKMGEIKPRVGKLGIGEPTMSFGCPTCDSIFDPFYVRMELASWRRVWEEEPPHLFETTLYLYTPITAPLDHWCYSPDSEFCSAERHPVKVK